jgi:hypothetical protein
MKTKPKHFFLTMGLENADEVVSPAEVHEQLPIGEVVTDLKSDEPSSDELVVEEDFGTDEYFEDENIDAVTFLQEHVIATESLFSSIARFARVGAALENLSEDLQAKAEEGGIDAATAVMLTEAVDSAGVGDDLGEQVATESFHFDQRVATESLAETFATRAKSVFDAIGKFMKGVYSTVRKNMTRFADNFRAVHSIFEKVLKESGDLLDKYAGKSFEDAKREKAITKALFAPSSVKTILAVLQEGEKEVIDNYEHFEDKVFLAYEKLSRVYATGSPTDTIKQMNTLLGNLKSMLSNGKTKGRFSAHNFEAQLPERYEQSGTQGSSIAGVEWHSGNKDFDASLKIASSKEIRALMALAKRAQAYYSHAFDTAVGGNYETKLSRRQDGIDDNTSRVDMRSLSTKYRALAFYTVQFWANTTWSYGMGHAINADIAGKWVRQSAFEAKRLAREEK